jgi:hypothetical protein
MNSQNSIQLKTETGVRPATCDSLSFATVVLLNDLGAVTLESQIASLTPVFVFAFDILLITRDSTERSARFYTEENLGRRVYTEPDIHC